tara:strand:- start:887 stop:1471 length:585 start_codon:yes stop_codon:yes gene_type:complete
MIIGILGNKNVGKDTLANYLVQTEGFKKISFATNLKNCLKVMFNWNDNNLSFENKEVDDEIWKVSPRMMLQLLGTEFLRDYCKDVIDCKINFNGKEEEFSYHIKKLFLDNIELFRQNENIVISDVRFSDEVKFIKWLNGKIIKLERKKAIVNNYNNHKSENNINNLEYDFKIQNNFSKEHLFKTFNILSDENNL